MDNQVLKKKLNTYKSSKGSLKGVSNNVVIEVLQAWQNWPSSTADLYRELDLGRGQMSVLIRAGKKLAKSGVVVESDFKEIKVEATEAASAEESCRSPITMKWEKGKIIRFSQVNQLVDFLKKVA
jgi:hypothetical protein